MTVPEHPGEDDRFMDEAHAIAHDDIMKRLLAYQRQLRGGLEGSSWTGPVEAREAPPVATATEELVDVGAAESEMATPAPAPAPGPLPAGPAAAEPEPWQGPTPAEAPSGGLEARVAELEATLAQLDAMLGDLRRRFQELAVAADEKIASIRDAAARARAKDDRT